MPHKIALSSVYAFGVKAMNVLGLLSGRTILRAGGAALDLCAGVPEGGSAGDADVLVDAKIGWRIPDTLFLCQREHCDYRGFVR
jgi:hypothetical protein